MSASGLPYHLRPGKYVDRELFAEFVAQLVANGDPDQYVYVSMGGAHLSDHRAVYRRSGVRFLYSFDLDEQIVERQRFFRPFEEVRCELHSSVELPQKIDNILDGFGGRNLIAWLDFTKSVRTKQLGEVQALASRLQPGDVLRVTLNLEPREREEMERSLPLEQRTMGELHAAYLRHLTGDYLPANIKDLDARDIPQGLAQCVRSACERGMGTGPARSATPVLLTTYKDTTQMFVATVLIQNEGESGVPPGWRFAPTDWSTITKIDLPNFTPFEKARFDEFMHLSADDLRQRIGFQLTPAGRDEETLEQYRRLHRFYPLFESLAI